MNIESTPPKLPTALDVWLRPVAVELRSAPSRPPFTLTYVSAGQWTRATTRAAADDDDPPRMQRMLATSTSTSSFTASLSYSDCDRYAVITGQPYCVDVRVLGAKSDAIIERLNHDYAIHYVERGASHKSTST